MSSRSRPLRPGNERRAGARRGGSRCCAGSAVSRFGFMDDFADQSLMLAFQWRGRRVQLRASAKGWAAMYLRKNPWHNRRRTGKQEWERRAVEQGMVAVNSVLRDWIKGQITAVESGLLAFDHVFLTSRSGRILDQQRGTTSSRYAAPTFRYRPADDAMPPHTREGSYGRKRFRPC